MARPSASESSSGTLPRTTSGELTACPCPFGDCFNVGETARVLDCPPGLYRGRVQGTESGSCEARIEVRKLPGGCLGLDYEAVGAQGVQHVEHTIVAPGLLFVAHSQAPGVSVFTESAAGVFDGPSGGPYALRLVISWDETTLVWSWHWGGAGDEPIERSRAEVRLAD